LAVRNIADEIVMIIAIFRALEIAHRRGSFATGANGSTLVNNLLSGFVSQYILNELENIILVASLPLCFRRWANLGVGTIANVLKFIKVNRDKFRTAAIACTFKEQLICSGIVRLEAMQILLGIMVSFVLCHWGWVCHWGYGLGPRFHNSTIRLE
jgi:hypothetical protein